MEEDSITDTSTGRARYGLFVLVLLGFVFTTDITLTALLLEPMKLDLRLSDLEIALVQGTAYGLALGIASLPMGRLIDRYSRRTLIAIGLLLWAGAFATIAFANTLPILIVARITLGLVVALVVPATFSMAADLYGIEQRSAVTSFLVVGQALGQGFGMLAGGYAFDALTTAAASGQSMFGLAPWREIYLVAAGFGLILLLLLIPMREPIRHEIRGEDTSLHGALVQMRAFAKFLLPLIAAMLFAQVAIQSVSVWTSPMLIRRGLTPGEFAGWMSVILFAGGIFGALAGGRLAEFGRRRRGRVGVLLPGIILALVMVPASLFAVAPSLIAFGGLLALHILAGAVVATVGVIAITVIMPNDVRGLTLGANTLVSAIFGAAGAPALIAMISTRLGGEEHLSTAFVLVAMPSAALAAIALTLAARSAPLHIASSSPPD